ncbi:hypothetical protein H7F15_05880 [Pontibacter sp. Tf4]|uniref:hypothetical protein n=1 Tax=Pontibacter sp. Tf4 TaxID=2761620 RepID=UPI0016246AEC|nr:hypothetical protein [Pontibacter sp. Tf4]MBB6610558.1 hypothetical protein [Pontibacter sp. Tf4]
MKTNYLTSNDYSIYLQGLLKRAPTVIELHAFEENQDLLLITKMVDENDACHLTFTKSTSVKLLPTRLVRGSTIQLHSQQDGHRFYTVLLDEPDFEDTRYLMLDAAVETISLDDTIITLIRDVQLMTVEEFVLRYSPVLCNLN